MPIPRLMGSGKLLTCELGRCDVHVVQTIRKAAQCSFGSGVAQLAVWLHPYTHMRAMFIMV